MNKDKKRGLGRGLSALFGDQSSINKPIKKVEINKLAIGDLDRIFRSSNSRKYTKRRFKPYRRSKRI